MKKLLSLVLAMAMSLSLVACSSSDDSAATTTTASSDSTTAVETVEDAAAANDPKQTIMVAHWFAEDHPIHLAMLEFEAQAEALSGGSLQVDIYPNAQLGSEDTYIDSVTQGTVQIGVTGTMIAKYQPSIYAQETPFIFSTWEDTEAILNGEIGAMLLEGFEEASAMVHMGTMVNGFREFSSNIAMYSMDDFVGQRIRVPNVPHYIEMVEALGASPIVMSLTDLFTGLEQKTVDGQDNPYATDAASSYYEVQDYILESRHMFSPANVVINANFYNNTLTDAQREALDTAMDTAISYNWDISETADEESKQILLDAGVEITVPDEAFAAELQAAMDPVYEWFYTEIPETREFIEACLAY